MFRKAYIFLYSSSLLELSFQSGVGYIVDTGVSPRNLFCIDSTIRNWETVAVVNLITHALMHALVIIRIITMINRATKNIIVFLIKGVPQSENQFPNTLLISQEVILSRSLMALLFSLWNLSTDRFDE